MLYLLLIPNFTCPLIFHFLIVLALVVIIPGLLSIVLVDYTLLCYIVFIVLALLLGFLFIFNASLIIISFPGNVDGFLGKPSSFPVKLLIIHLSSSYLE